MTQRGGSRPRDFGDQAHRRAPFGDGASRPDGPEEPPPPGSQPYSAESAGPRERRSPTEATWDDAGQSGEVRRGLDEPQARATRSASAAARYAARNGNGGHHVLRFLAFALVLAALVLGGLALVLRPVLSRSITDWAAENSTALHLPFVPDIVRSELGASLTDPAAADPATVKFTVQLGESPAGLAARLQQAGLLGDQRAFVFLTITRDVAGEFQAGTYFLRANMTPDQLLTALTEPPPDPTIQIGIREGLRLEQITALLQKMKAAPSDPSKPLTMDVAAFRQLAEHPTAILLADYPWLKLPKGASLEGFLAPATYTVLPDITPEQLIRKMLDHFAESVHPDQLKVPSSHGLDLYQAVTLASIVELEARVDQERALIAGVYQNRLDKGRPPLLNADPTVIYANDTVQLRALPLDQWPTYSFWEIPKAAMADVQVPPDLVGYQTYQHTGPIPGPICTPKLASIQAALAPDTAAGYLYFVAKGDGSETHAFARTWEEFQALLKKYGYVK